MVGDTFVIGGVGGRGFFPGPLRRTLLDSWRNGGLSCGTDVRLPLMVRYPGYCC